MPKKSADAQSSAQEAGSEPLLKVQDATTDEVFAFLMDTFVPIEGGLSERRTIDMAGYARLAQFLSNKFEFAGTAAELSNAVAELVRQIKDDNRFIADFLRWLGFFAHCFGFSKDIYTLSGQVRPEAFAEVVAQKILFRDCFTRPHGEFSHTVQWLVMACHFDGTLPVADLYANSVKYNSGSKSFKFVNGKKVELRPVEMWNFLVDCFEGNENFRSNIMSETFRCPQVVTNELHAVLPTEIWFAEFLYQRRHLGLTTGGKAPPGSHYEIKRNIVWRKKYLERMLATYYDQVTKGTGIFRLKEGSLR